MGLTIGFVFDDTLDVLDGVQQHIVTIGRELTRRGHTVHYLVGETHDSPVDNTFSMSSNIMVKFNGNRMRIPKPASRDYIQEVLTNGQYDILHVQAPYSPLMAGRVLGLADDRTGIVATYHIASANRMAALGGKLLGKMNNKSHQRVDEVIAVSQIAAQYAQQTAHAHGVVIPNPVDVEQLRALAHGTQPQLGHIVFLGRFVERKGATILLDAIAWGEKNHLFPDGTHVSFAGKGPLLEACKQQASTLHTPIEFLGFVSEEDKPALLASAEVAVFPATGGESFGIVLAEAIASGAYVTLAGDNPGYRSTMLDDDDVLFDVSSDHAPKILAERIAKALTNKSWAAQVHERELGLVERYDVRNVVDQLEQVYTQAISDHDLY